MLDPVLIRFFGIFQVKDLSMSRSNSQGHIKVKVIVKMFCVKVFSKASLSINMYWFFFIKTKLPRQNFSQKIPNAKTMTDRKDICSARPTNSSTFTFQILDKLITLNLQDNYNVYLIYLAKIITNSWKFCL